MKNNPRHFRFIFGVLAYGAKEYFTAFTYILVGLSILGVYLLLKKLKKPITIVKRSLSLGLS